MAFSHSKNGTKICKINKIQIFIFNPYHIKVTLSELHATTRWKSSLTVIFSPRLLPWGVGMRHPIWTFQQIPMFLQSSARTVNINTAFLPHHWLAWRRMLPGSVPVFTLTVGPCLALTPHLTPSPMPAAKGPMVLLLGASGCLTFLAALADLYLSLVVVVSSLFWTQGMTFETWPTSDRKTKWLKDKDQKY